MKLFIIFLFILSSCAQIKKDLKKRELLQASWVGRSLQELISHPYFSKLKFQESPNQKTYIRRGQFQSRAYCESMGGCQGMESGDCYHHFYFKLEKIEKYEQLGNCRIDNQNSLTP